MLIISEFSRRDFWSSAPISMKTGAPYRFHEWISLYRFDALINNIGLIQDKQSEYKRSILGGSLDGEALG